MSLWGVMVCTFWIINNFPLFMKAYSIILISIKHVVFGIIIPCIVMQKLYMLTSINAFSGIK